MKQRRVGTISLGFILIALGVLLLGNTIWNIPINSFIIYGWPIVLITIGIEVLVFSFNKKEVALKFDVFSVFVIFLTIMFTFFVYTVQTSGIITALNNAIQGERYSIELEHSLELPASVKEVWVEIPNGNISINGKNTNTAKLEGILRVNATDRQNAEDIKDKIFTMQVLGDKAIIRIERPNEARFLGNQDVSTDLAVTLPNKLDVRGLTRNGDIFINGFDGMVNIDSYNGDVEGKNLIGEVSIDSKNGEIQIDSIVAGDWDIKNVNGDISINLPKDTNANISAETKNGEVEGDVNWQDTSDVKDNNHDIKKIASVGSGNYNISAVGSNSDIEVNLAK